MNFKIYRNPSSLKGIVVKYGDDINTDAIIPSKYLDKPNPNYFDVILTGIDKSFPMKIRNYYQEYKLPVVVIAGKNFGSGSSREQAAEGLKTTTIATIAESFSTTFFRNCMNVGYPAIKIANKLDKVKEGYTLEINLLRGIVQVIHPINDTYQFTPVEHFLIKRIERGGLLPELKKLVLKLGLN